MATTYPDAIQFFPEMVDIEASDAALVNLYQQYIRAGDMANAQIVLSQITDAASKIVTADFMNTITDTCYALQLQFSKKYSPAYIVSPTQPIGQEVNDFWFDVTFQTVAEGE